MLGQGDEGNTGNTLTENQFHVLHSYVLPWARRQKVRTRINQAIFEANFQRIVTGGSTDDGVAFMKASGYELHEKLDQWSLVKP